MKKNPLLKLAAAALFSGVSGVFADITYDITSDYVLDADYSISQIQTVSNGATYTIAKSLTNSASGYVLTLSNGKTEILEGGYMLQSVPEPAEWAAVFGAAALALALRRKTKNLRR